MWHNSGKGGSRGFWVALGRVLKLLKRSTRPFQCSGGRCMRMWHLECLPPSFPTEISEQKWTNSEEISLPLDCFFCETMRPLTAEAILSSVLWYLQTKASCLMTFPFDKQKVRSLVSLVDICVDSFVCLKDKAYILIFCKLLRSKM